MANQEDLQEDDNGSLREEFHQLIVPLIRLSLHDKPTDLAAYCSRYFQTVLEERQRGDEGEKVELPESGGSAEESRPVSQVQESTSLPILTDVHRDPLSLRETSSWNNPADSSRKPRRLRDISYDVADAMSRIGDRPDKEDVQENLEAKGSDDRLFVGDDGSRDRSKDFESREVRSDDSSKKRSIVEESPADREREEESDDIPLPSSSLSAVPPSASCRKKWSSNVDSASNLILKSEFSEAIDGEDEPVPDSNPKPLLLKDHEVESPGVSSETSLGHISAHKKLKSSPRTKQTSSPFIQKEVVDSVKIISRSLQELLKVLESMKSFCNENLQRFQTLSEALPEKSLPAPRKKRSVTTFSSSDNLHQDRQFSGAPENKPASSSAGKGCTKSSQTSSDLKSADSAVESDVVGSDCPLRSKIVDEFIKKEKVTPSEDDDVGPSDNLAKKKGVSFDKNLDKNDRDMNGNKIGSRDTCLNWKSGIVNKGFLIDDSESHRRSHRQGQQRGQNWWQANGSRRRMLNGPNPFSQIRMSRLPLGRNINPSQNHDRTAPRQAPGFRFPYIGEGGDVFAGQCSVATATEATQTTERPGFSDTTMRSARIHPVSNGTAEQGGCASKQQSNGGNSGQVSEEGSSLSDQQSSKPCKVQAVESPDEEVREEIVPSKKSSSLNPCAECFNPPSELVQNLEGLKLSDESDAHESSGMPIELLVENFPEAEADWDYEMFLDDFLLEDQEPILYQNLDSDGRLVSLTMEEVEGQHKFENECSLLDYSREKNNGPTQGRDGASSCEKRVEDKKKCHSDMKLAEGDQGLGVAEEGAERCDSAEKREEPGLSSACGDFVAAENNNEEAENPGDGADCDAQVAVVPDLIALDMENPEFLPVDGNDDASMRVRQQAEEMELNFACFSGSDSSEVDSSDMSEEETEFSGENGENKLKETT